MATYYVAPAADGGSNSNPGTIGSPWLTINYGTAQLVAGDTLYIRGGIYDGDIGSSYFTASGTSWSAPITVAAYPTETVTIYPWGDWCLEVTGAREYLIFDGFIIDGIGSDTASNVIFTDDGVAHIKLRNLEIKEAWMAGILGGSHGGDLDITFENLYVHHNTRVPFATYPQGSSGVYWVGDNLTIQGGVYSDNDGFAIRYWDSAHPTHMSENNVIDGVTCYNNGYGLGRNGASVRNGGGVTLGDVDNIVKNSVFYNNEWVIDNTWGYGLRVLIYNNTFYANINGAVNVGPFEVDTEIKNNIFWQNGSTIVDNGTDTVQSNNLTTDPSFVNAGSADFLLQSGSSARDAGTTLGSVTDDFDGITRPQGGAYDIGAYEFEVGGGGATVVFVGSYGE